MRSSHVPSVPNHAIEAINENSPVRVMILWLDSRDLLSLIKGTRRLSQQLPADSRVLYVWCEPSRGHAWGIAIESAEFSASERGAQHPNLENGWEFLHDGKWGTVDGLPL